jgi:hypothetical protein
MQRDSEIEWAMTERPTKITFAEMRDMGVRGLLVYCADFPPSGWEQRSAPAPAEGL